MNIECNNDTLDNNIDTTASQLCRGKDLACMGILYWQILSSMD